MKIESFDRAHALPYFFNHGKDVSGSIPEPLKSESESEQSESPIEDTLRWADDGGQMLDPGNMMAGSNSKLSGAVR